ncbi:MAG TPA: signal peptidase II [Mucilaginibacter sp.]|jgi:signal peptidase II|nr:signal peptidase II [Mucilaginibacter sp.]
MNSKRLVRTLVILLVLGLNIGCDQVSKTIVRNKMEIYDRITYLHRHITFQRVENTGAFLSFGDSLSGPLRMILLNILPLVAVLLGLVYILVKPNINRVKLLGIILIIGGGFGNIYDRIVHGSVTDFMHINFVIFQTGVFNVADMSIMAGMFIVLIHSFMNRTAEADINNLDESKI